MKKFNFTILVFLLSIVLIGCGGHESEKQLTDVEQFRCQDSIQTVFDVLGKKRIQDENGNIVKYEKMNLYGYNGNIIFSLRDDKDTIKDFNCVLTLNKNEFKDVLNYFEEKYGDYEEGDYFGYKTYNWQVAEENGEIGYYDLTEEIGFDTITICCHTGKKYSISFEDEWSDMKDEKYYEKVEYNTSKVIVEKEYSIDDDKFIFSCKKEKGEYNISINSFVENKSDIFDVFLTLRVSTDSKFYSDIDMDENTKKLFDGLSENFSFSIVGDDGCVIMVMHSIDTIIASKDGEMIDLEKYFSAEWFSSEYKNGGYGEQVTNFYSDFIESLPTEVLESFLD